MKPAVPILALALLATPAQAKDYWATNVICLDPACHSWMDETHCFAPGHLCDEWAQDHDQSIETLPPGKIVAQHEDQTPKKLPVVKGHSASGDYFIILKCHDDQCKPYHPPNPNQLVGGRYECTATCGEWPNVWCPDPKTSQCNAKDEPK